MPYAAAAASSTVQVAPAPTPTPTPARPPAWERAKPYLPLLAAIAAGALLGYAIASST